MFVVVVVVVVVVAAAVMLVAVAGWGGSSNDGGVGAYVCGSIDIGGINIHLHETYGSLHVCWAYVQTSRKDRNKNVIEGTYNLSRILDALKLALAEVLDFCPNDCTFASATQI